MLTRSSSSASRVLARLEELYVLGGGRGANRVAGSDAELAAWRHYLVANGIPATEVMERSGFRSIYLRDPDGHIVEIAATA